ncbi:MAG: hypothetical protein JNM17_22705 [Archangium sp.]|nr:hypothetical protein [Archangium sp.]
MARRKKTAARVAPIRIPEVRAKVAAWQSEDDEEWDLTEAEWKEIERRVEASKHEKNIPAQVLLDHLAQSRLSHERRSRSSKPSPGGEKTARRRHISSKRNSATR